MEMKELRAQNENALIKQLANLREQVRDMRFKVHSKEVKNSHEMGEIKREIARILTILNEKKD